MCRIGRMHEGNKVKSVRIEDKNIMSLSSHPCELRVLPISLPLSCSPFQVNLFRPNEISITSRMSLVRHCRVLSAF